MRTNCILFCICFWSMLAGAQEYPKAEIFAGYSYLSVDQNSGPRTGASGFELSASGNFTRWFALETDFSGYFQHLRDGGGTAGTFSYVAGPRVNFARSHHALNPLFLHFQLGFQHLVGTDFGSSVSDTAIASALGGGAEWKLTSHMALRASADYAMTHYVTTQNNIRTSVGVAYVLGGGTRK